MQPSSPSPSGAAKATAPPEQILLTAGDGQAAAGQIADIAGVQPALGVERGAGFLGHLEIAGHHAGPAQMDDAGLMFAEYPAFLVADLYFIAG